MVEFDCADCDITLEAVTSPVRSWLAEDEGPGTYAPHVLRCPRCGASWEQHASGRLAKSW
jgi:hypothetical protein